MFILLLMAITFGILGVMIRFCKWYWLIAGYNTMPKEKKQKIDIEGLGRFMGNCLFVMAGLLGAGSVAAYFRVLAASTAVVVAVAAVFIYMMIKAQQFDPHTRNADGTMKTSVKIILASVVAFFTLIGVFVFINAFPSEVVVNKDYIQVKGIYGLKIEMEEINNITLEESLPAVLRKINGFNAGNTLKGHFELQDAGRARLYVNIGKPPFIYLDTVEGIIIINQGDRQSTEELYRTIVHSGQ